MLYKTQYYLYLLRLIVSMSVVQDVKIHTPTHDVFAGPEGGVLSLP